MSQSTEPTQEPVVGERTAIRVSSREPVGELMEAVVDAAGQVPVAAVGSTGAAGVEPLLVATDDGVTRYYLECLTEQGQEVARALASGWTPPGGHAAVEHPAGVGWLPVPADGPLGLGQRSVLGRAGWVSPASEADYEAAGGLAALEAAGTPEAALDALGDLGGRGWGDAAADEPIVEQWRTARFADGDPAVVVNAHGNPADRLLLESTPLAVLEGALVAARVVGASEVYVYPNEADGLARERAEAAVDAIDRAAIPGDVAAIDVVPGPDEYKAAEPTMAIEAIEGNHRLEARRRPPGPAEYGLFGRPTLVHTPRTLLGLAELWRDSGAFDPDAADPGTRLVTVGGDVPAPATVELPTDVSLSRALDAAAETDTGAARFVVGGRFGGLTRSLEVPANAPTLSAAGLGTEGIVEVLAPERCVVATVGERAAFAREENCGRCVPCREGSKQLHELLRAVYDGEFDAGAVLELGRTMATTSLCAFGEAAARPVRTGLEEFEGEFRAHAEGRCPAGACEGMA